MNRKQKGFLCIFICVIGILSGCSKAENNVINTSDKCAQAGYFENNCRLAEGKSGDYIMDIIYPYAVSFIEEGQDKRIYLCGKPDCEHQDGRGGVLTTCDSYVGEIILSSLVFYDEWLYMLSYDEKTYTVSLSRVSKEGVVHETLGVIDQAPYNGSNFSYLVVGDKIYYTQAQDWDDSIKNSTIQEISLSTKKTKIFYSYESPNSGIVSLKYFNNYLYFREYDNGIGMLSRIDVATGVKEVLADADVSSFTINASGNELFYWIPGEGMHKVELDDLSSSLVRKCDENIFYMELACDEKYIYLSNYRSYNFYEDASIERSITILNMNGEQEGLISLEKYKGRPLCVTEDRIYVEIIEPEEGRVFAFIDKDKMLSKNAELTKIRKQ